MLSFFTLPKFPIDLQLPEPPSQLHEYMEDEMELIDNNNQKFRIKVWRNPYDQSGLGPNPQKKKEKEDKKTDKLKCVVNCFDRQARDSYYVEADYEEDLKNGYDAIEIQNNQDKILRLEGEKHFIRQKQGQSSINLKRTCGVSYVKPTESE